MFSCLNFVLNGLVHFFFVHLSLITICDVTKGKEVISPAVPLAQGAVAKGISVPLCD